MSDLQKNSAQDIWESTALDNLKDNPKAGARVREQPVSQELKLPEGPIDATAVVPVTAPDGSSPDPGPSTTFATAPSVTDKSKPNKSTSTTAAPPSSTSTTQPPPSSTTSTTQAHSAGGGTSTTTP